MKKNMWEKIPTKTKKLFIWIFWFFTWFGLLLGLKNSFYYEMVVYFSLLHMTIVLLLTKWNVKLFPSQVRIAYFFWVAIGTFIPGMTFLMYITTIGLAANLFFGYCPLARMLYLFPWNNDRNFSFKFMIKVLTASPSVFQSLRIN